MNQSHIVKIVITRGDIYFQLFGRLCRLPIPAVFAAVVLRRTHTWYLWASTDNIYTYIRWIDGVTFGIYGALTSRADF